MSEELILENYANGLEQKGTSLSVQRALKQVLEWDVKTKQYLVDALEQKPFSEKIDYDDVVINQIGRQYGDPAMSWEIAEVLSGGESYKLRRCETEEKAKKITDQVRVAQELPDRIPKFYGRDKESLLFDRIEQWEVFTKAPWTDKYVDIWRLFADFNWIQGTEEEINEAKQSFQKNMLEYIDELSSVFGERILAKVKKKIEDGFANIPLDFAFDVADGNPANFMYDSKKNLLAIDEENWRLTARWMGMINYLSSWDFGWKNSHEMYTAAKNVFEWYQARHGELFPKEQFEFLLFLIILKWLWRAIQKKKPWGVSFHKRTFAYLLQKKSKRNSLKYRISNFFRRFWKRRKGPFLHVGSIIKAFEEVNVEKMAFLSSPG